MAREKLEIMVERLFPSGDYLLTTIHGDEYLKQRYSGYTKREAISLFREYVRSNGPQKPKVRS